MLLHGLMDGDSVFRAHLVHFVDTCDSLVSQHEGASFKSHPAAPLSYDSRR
jgi:hypothetical protein